MTVEIRTLLSEELNYYRRCIPGRDAARKSAARIVNLLEKHPYALDQIPYDRLAMIRRESQGLSPVP